MERVMTCATRQWQASHRHVSHRERRQVSPEESSRRRAGRVGHRPEGRRASVRRVRRGLARDSPRQGSTAHTDDTQGYEALLRRNIRPHFGRTKLRQITPERVREWHSKVTAESGSDQAAKSYRLLRAILMTAVSDELIARNPCGIKGAGIEHAEERPMLDTSTVFNLADAIVPRLRALILVAGFGTLRPGELLGLQRGDIDLLHGTVHVQREAHEITGQGRILTPPKSEAGDRTVALPAEIRDELSDHLDAYVAPEPEAYVFTRPSDDRYAVRTCRTPGTPLVRQ